MTEALAIFHRDKYTIVGGIANTMCPMSSGDGKKTECFSLKMIGLNSKVNVKHDITNSAYSLAALVWQCFQNRIHPHTA